MRQRRTLLVFAFSMLMVFLGCFHGGKRVNPVDPKYVYYRTASPTLTFTVTVTPVVLVGDPNVCPGAFVDVSTLPVVISGNTNAATDKTVSCGLGNTAADHIYFFTLASATSITVSLCFSDYDTVIAFGTSCGDDSLGCDDDGCAIMASTLSFPSLAAGTYYIAVDGYDETGDYKLIISSP
jgi:hypothetical protein